jgi:hypothetical protein
MLPILAWAGVLAIEANSSIPRSHLTARNLKVCFIGMLILHARI